MSDAAFVSRTWSIGRYECTLTVPRPQPGQMMSAVVEWSPSEPSRLTGQELALYRMHRNQAVAELAAELHINVAVLDL